MSGHRKWSEIRHNATPERLAKAREELERDMSNAERAQALADEWEKRLQGWEKRLQGKVEQALVASYERGLREGAAAILRVLLEREEREEDVFLDEETVAIVRQMVEEIEAGRL